MIDRGLAEILKRGQICLISTLHHHNTVLTAPFILSEVFFVLASSLLAPFSRPSSAGGKGIAILYMAPELLGSSAILFHS